MLDRQIKLGSTSNIIRVKLRKADTAQGITALSSASSGLRISTICDNEASATVYTVAASLVEACTSLGTFTAPTASKVQFSEVDSTNHPGTYELHIADARFAVASAKVLRVSILGAANLLERELVIELVGYDPIAADVGQSGDAYAIVNSGTYGNAQLVRATTPANTLTVDSSHQALGLVNAYASSAVTPLQPATAGRTVVVDAAGLIDANVVKVGPTGSGTAQTARDLGLSVLLSAGTGTGQLDFTSGVVKANLVQILAAAITGTAAQIVAAFTKFFDKASPTGTINSLPDAVPGASGGLPTTNGTKLSQTVDLTSGQSIAASSVPAVTLANGAHGGAAAIITLLTPIAATVPDTQKVDLNTIKTEAVTCATPVTILANLGFAGAPGAANGPATTNGTKLNQTVDLTSGQTVAATVAGAVGSVSGDVGGKVLGGGASAITGTGVRAVDAAGNAIAPATTALTNATWTDARAGYLDVLNGLLASIWGYTTRTLSAFGFTVAATVADKTGCSLTSDYDAAKTAAPTAAANADKLLGRNLAGGSDGGRTVQDALRVSRNKAKVTKISNVAGTLTVYKENDTDIAWTAPVVLDATAAPITEVDPT